MSSLNGDLTVIRNGRSTSQVSIYNYPEHLNPFYEEDNHKRLRFWKLGHSSDNQGRRNSFSLGGLKDVWSFKSFRLKKKSSTLGINKTSESPPPLRRQIVSDPYTSDAAISLGNNPLFRPSSLRNSWQTVYHPQALNENNNGFGFNRNDQYRNTIQTGGTTYMQQKKTLPSSRYIFGGSVTPQLLRNGRSESLGTMSRGSSQASVCSTNPFETDTDENDVTVKVQGQHFSTPKRKKRRAPAPPISIKPDISKSMSETDPRRKTSLDCGQSNNELTIVELTAEIEKFVNTSNVDTNKLSDVDKQSNDLKVNIDSPNENNSGALNEENQSVVKIEKTEQCHVIKTNQINVQEDVPSNNKEVGHIECIHVHLDTLKPTTSINSEPSRVTSFKNITADTNEKTSNVQTHTNRKNLEEPEHKIHKKDTGSLNPTSFEKEKIYAGLHEKRSDNFAQKVDHDCKEHEITYIEKKNTHESFKPPLAAKPNNIAKSKTVPVPSSTNNSNALLITEKELDGALKLTETPKQNLSIEAASQLKIEEPERDFSTLGINEISKNKDVHFAAFDKNQKYPIDLIYRPKPMSQLEWKKSTLATLETNVPPEKRKSVKDIIESINRSQKLLGASASKNQTSQNCLSLINNNEKQQNLNSEVSFRISKPNTQIQSCELNNNLDQNLRALDESQIESQCMLEEITVANNSGKISNNCIANVNKIPIKIQNTSNNEHHNEENNNEVFQKCKINKEVYNTRESSPTASNLDWNPVPKPKRALNTPSPKLNKHK